MGIQKGFVAFKKKKKKKKKKRKKKKEKRKKKIEFQEDVEGGDEREKREGRKEKRPSFSSNSGLRVRIWLISK